MAKTSEVKVVDLTAASMAKLAGVSVRRLQWWDEQGIVEPEMRKHVRYYTPDQVQKVIALAKLRKAGITLKKSTFLLRKAERITPLLHAIDYVRECGLRVHG